MEGMDYLRGTDAAPVSFAEQPENLDLDYISSLLHEPFGESSDTVATKAEAKNPQALEDYVNRALAAQNKYIDKSVNAQSKFVDRGVEGVNRYVDNVDERAAAINQAWDDYVNKSVNAKGEYIDNGAGAMNGAVDQYAEGAGKANPNGIKINAGKQNKHILGTNNYNQSIASGVNRSILKENPQQLLDDFAGTGQRIPNTNKERIDFGKIIGQYYDPKTNTYIDTTRGIIHYDSKGGAHIVPAPPKGY